MEKSCKIETPKPHRLFIAAFAKFEHYDELKVELDPFFDGKWVKKKNLHMTFKFLGDVADIDNVVKKLKKLNYPKKQTVVFQKLRVFHKSILSLRSSNKTLYKLHDQIEDLLKGQFISNKSFKPHITLMRIKKIKYKSYKEKFDRLRFTADLKVKVCLVESKLNSDGVKYKILREF